jgi:hypothetical protein
MLEGMEVFQRGSGGILPRKFLKFEALPEF